MRTACKHILLAFVLAHAPAAYAVGAAQLGPGTAPGASRLSQAQLTCNQQQPPYLRSPGPPPQYDQAAIQRCQTCSQTVREQQQAVQSAREGAVGRDSAAVARGTAAQAANGARPVGRQTVADGNANQGYGAGNGAQQERSGIARQLESAARQCAQKIQSDCQGSLAQQDQEAAQQAKEGCEQIAQGAGTAATQRAAEGSGMQGLGDLAKALGQGLQSMMGQQGGKGNQGSNPSDPYSSLAGTSPTPDASGLNGGNTEKIDGATFDKDSNKSGTSSVAFGADKTSGNSSTGQADFDPTRSAVTGFQSTTGSGGRGSGSGASNRYGAGDGYGSGEFGGSGAGSSASGSAGGLGSFGGGSSSMNGTGASRAQDFAKAGDKAAEGSNPYEVNAAGGGKAILGLKSKGNELSELDAMVGQGGGEGKMEDEGGRGLASEDHQASGQDAVPDGITIFKMVRTRYAELKKSGNI